MDKTINLNGFISANRTNYIHLREKKETENISGELTNK